MARCRGSLPGERARGNVKVSVQLRAVVVWAWLTTHLFVYIDVNTPVIGKHIFFTSNCTRRLITKMAANKQVSGSDSDATVGYSVASDLALTSDEDEPTPRPSSAPQSVASVSTPCHY